MVIKNSKIRINWPIIISIIGIVLTAIWKFYPVEAELKYNVLANANVLDLKADVAKLSISYDSIDLIKSKQSISLVIVEIKNDGNKDIRLEDYDKTTDIGIQINSGVILNKPTVNNSSDNNYFKDIVDGFSENKIKFRYKLLDSNQFFTLKFLVLHSRDITPMISPIGKVSGMEKIEVTNSEETNAELTKLRRKYQILTYSGLLSFFLVTFIFVLIFQQRIRSRDLLLKKLEINENLSDTQLTQLSLEEMVELKKGISVYHDRFGLGEVISIERGKNIEDSKGTFRFESSGQKRLLLRFAQLYKLDS